MLLAQPHSTAKGAEVNKDSKHGLPEKAASYS